MRTSLRTVLDAFVDGARTVDDLADRTGLDPDLVRVALDQLVALGLVDAAPLASNRKDLFPAARRRIGKIFDRSSRAKRRLRVRT